MKAKMETNFLWEVYDIAEEISLDGAGFIQRHGGDCRPWERTHLFLCVSFVQVVVKRQSCRSWNGTRCDFLIATIARARATKYNCEFHLGGTIVAATKTAYAWPA